MKAKTIAKVLYIAAYLIEHVSDGQWLLKQARLFTIKKRKPTKGRSK